VRILNNFPRYSKRRCFGASHAGGGFNQPKSYLFKNDRPKQPSRIRSDDFRVAPPRTSQAMSVSLKGEVVHEANNLKYVENYRTDITDIHNNLIGKSTHLSAQS
jgi:hypothetical protein